MRRLRIRDGVAAAERVWSGREAMCRVVGRGRCDRQVVARNKLGGAMSMNYFLDGDGGPRGGAGGGRLSLSFGALIVLID